MLVVVSDSHAIDDHQLHGRTLEAVCEAEVVIHAGDFMTEAVLDAFDDIASELHGVCGNADDPDVCERLPESRTVEYAEVTIAVTHRRDGGATGLSLFGRERGAALVVSGHTHRPTLTEGAGVTLLNPGSYAQPRGNRPGHAELTPVDDGIEIELREPSGTLIDSTVVRR